MYIWKAQNWYETNIGNFEQIKNRCKWLLIIIIMIIIIKVMIYHQYRYQFMNTFREMENITLSVDIFVRFECVCVVCIFFFLNKSHTLYNELAILSVDSFIVTEQWCWCIVQWGWCCNHFGCMYVWHWFMNDCIKSVYLFEKKKTEQNKQKINYRSSEWIIEEWITRYDRRRYNLQSSHCHRVQLMNIGL